VLLAHRRKTAMQPLIRALCRFVSYGVRRAHHDAPSTEPLQARDKTMKLLLVENNVDLARWLVAQLRAANFTVDWLADGESADSLMQTQHYDLVLLEMHLPHMTGKTVLTRLRRRHDTIPVLIMTVHSSIDDKVACFEAGADDYLVRPFDTRELLARIKVLIRRQFPNRNIRLSCGDLHYRSDTREFRRNDTRLALRPREHGVLEALMLNQGKTVSKQALMESIFGLDDDPSRDAIDTYIHRLRKHLAHSGAQILTMRGIGYILCAKDAALCEPYIEPFRYEASNEDAKAG
jgi:DNA-binding response OmpR family regulator